MTSHSPKHLKLCVFWFDCLLAHYAVWLVVGMLRVLVENLIVLPALILQRGTVLSR